MKSSVKLSALAIAVAMAFGSCNNEPSLQTYFVDHQEQSNFMAVDLPVSMLHLDTSALTETQMEAYQSLKKVNLLAYKADSLRPDQFEDELGKVKSILNQKKYEELMRGGNNEDGSFIIKTLGDGDEVDEFILFGTAPQKGFAIVRVMGKDMTPSKIMALAPALKFSNIQEGQLGQVMEFFK